MKSIDMWLARNVFYPIVTILCGLTRHTPQALSRGIEFLVFAGIAYFLPVIPGNSPSMIFKLVFFVLTFFMFSRAVFAADLPRAEYTFMRTVFIWAVGSTIVIDFVQFQFSFGSYAILLSLLTVHYAAALAPDPPTTN